MEKGKVVEMKPQMTQESIIENIKNKKGKIYIYTPNAKGMPSGGVAHVYDIVDILCEKGYNAFVLHDAEYIMPKWMGGNYSNLPHISFEVLSKQGVTPMDYLILPEFLVQSFYADLEKSKIKLPCEVIVLSQVYDLIFHNLDIGVQWFQFGIRNVITTTEKQKDFINSNLRGLNVHVVNPYIHNEFKQSDKPKKPFVLINSRVKEDGEKIVKMFYNRFPQYSWIPFKFAAMSDRSKFAKDISECCVAVWIDDIASFGTLPLECMKSRVPVIGKIPQMMPEWMGNENNGSYNIKDNGIWVLSSLNIVDCIGNYIDEWITDTLPNKIYDSMSKTVEKYSKENTINQLISTMDSIEVNRIERINTIFEKQNKTK